MSADRYSSSFQMLPAPADLQVWIVTNFGEVFGPRQVYAFGVADWHVESDDSETTSRHVEAILVAGVATSVLVLPPINVFTWFRVDFEGETAEDWKYRVCFDESSARMQCNLYREKAVKEEAPE